MALQEDIGFNNQGLLIGECAQRSLVHTLLLLGIPISQSTTYNKIGVSKLSASIDGTTDRALINGIKRCNCIPYSYEVKSSRDARVLINRFLIGGMPVIIFLEDMHWIVLAGKKSRDEYYWIDSYDDELYGYETWSEISYWMEEDGLYFLIGVRPEDSNQLRHSIVKSLENVYDYFDDEDLAEFWGVYLEDLTEIFDSPIDQNAIITPDRLFSDNSEKIVDAVEYYHGNTDKSWLKREMNRYLKVARSHNLSVSSDKEIDAVIKLTAALSQIA